MRKRPLGNTGLEVAEIGFGAWQLGNRDAREGADDAAARRLVDAAVDAGINLFDTAPNYAGGHSERLLGEALRGKRERVVLVSKFGHRPDGSTDFSIEWFRESLRESLRRLRTDHIDVFLLHNPDPRMYDGTDPVWEALAEARRQGVIGHFGASLDFAREAEACLRNTGSEVLEILFNVFHQDIRKAFPLVRKRGVGAVAKVPLDSGWLTGRFDARSRFSGVRGRWSEQDIAARAELVERIRWLTADGSALSHKAIAFLLAHEEVSCVIPGMHTMDQLRSNIEGADHTLAFGDRERLAAFWDEITNGGTHLLPW